MQRIVTLAILAVLVSGGWSALKGLSPQAVQQAVQKVGSVVGPVIAQQTQAPTTNTGYGAGYGGAPPYGAQNYGGQAGGGQMFGGNVPAANNGSGLFAPAPSVTAPPSIRIASFNIQVFGDAKASKPYVMQALAQVVRSFDVIAIQEIRTQDNYFIQKFLRDYVNVGATTGVYDARVSGRLGRTSSTEQYAYLFNTATVEVHPNFCAVVPDPEDKLHREPYAALFRTRVVQPYKPFTFTLINIHTDPDEVPQELDALYYVYRQVQRSSIDGAVEDDVILLGDLNTEVPANSRYTPNEPTRSISPSDLRMLAQIPGIAPLIRNQATNVRGTRLYDNLLIPSLTTVEYLDNGVMDLRTELDLRDSNGQRITPNQEQVLEISDHLPVWGKFSAIEGDSYRSAAR